MRAIGNIATVDPALLHDAQIRDAVADHLVYAVQAAQEALEELWFGTHRTKNARSVAHVLADDLFAAPTFSPAMSGRLRAVQIITAVHPGLLTVPRAKQLLPYVDGAQTPNEVAVMEELLRIFAQFLLALSYVLQAYPLKFLEPDVCKVLDHVFSEGAPLEQYFMLRALWGYLDRDATAPQEEAQLDMRKQLAGQNKVDAGVASALIQRYAVPILQATLEVNVPKTQQVASEIVKLSVLQGLSHPMQCVPYLVALETGDNLLLRHKAVQLHRYLLEKHSSMLSTRFGESVTMAFRFQQRLTAAPRGDLSPTPDDVNLSVFIADTLQVLEYRYAEEPLTILYELKMLDASTGIQIAGIIGRRLRREEHLREPSPLTDEENDSDVESVESRPMTDTLPHDKTAIGGPLRSTDLLSLAYAAKRVEILRRVRRTLKRMYRLPETKCAKFEPGKRTTLGDRPIALVSEAVL
ncbi:unnamed protein product [Malassezia sympodialis ATCC 42132]|uniref:uncharacterized protein n=1 Tax=Malassezia sympodialis (strain ATCC 42132) TaxID=1230383 RepID=UPI0002C2BAF4|nr:uncharacterized protein MSY001_0096 [Malassezia sympodialis ATCC 42132]CCU97390.1 unnamed protein product [Malassezia sympodialis ATCC 42132]|eukprot:XP_018738742.1 uncharacterized protein MSY001_0096 [Malassezia sympodialis ATCC 42132]